MDPSDAGLEGSLLLRIAAEAGWVATVDITSTRPLGVNGLLEDRPADEAIAALPLLYSLCGTAQSAAGLAACEAALGLSLSEAQSAARRMLVAGEAVGQTLWRFFIDLPPLIGETPQTKDLRAVLRSVAALRDALFAQEDWVRIGGARLRPDRDGLEREISALTECFTQGLLGVADPDPSPMAGVESFAAWSDRGFSPTARAFRDICHRGLAAFGASDCPLMPDIDLRELEARLANDDDGRFRMHPDHLGRVYETGALTQCREAPLVAELMAEAGNGLFVRLAARLVQVDMLLEQMREDLGSLRKDGQGGRVEDASGIGIAVVETARGRLVHRVGIEDGRVMGYRILAPTEWNFHPQGPLALGLLDSPVSDHETFRERVCLLVNALDPCVTLEIAVEEGSHA